jgi:hypothetical protein
LVRRSLTAPDKSNYEFDKLRQKKKSMNFEKIGLNELKIEPRQFLCAIQEPRDGHVNASLGQLRHDKKRKMEIKRSA